MRLWHKDMIDVLPKKQLIAQWRECCAIISNIEKKGTPNHILVNPIMHYTKSHFFAYCCLVCDELYKRGYNISEKSKQKVLSYVTDEEKQLSSRIEKDDDLFKGWFTDRYLVQCYYNLQEKYDRGMITEEEWSKVHCKISDIIAKNYYSIVKEN